MIAPDVRRLAVDSAVALVVIGTLAAVLYGSHLGNPLVFDSARWLSPANLPALRDLSMTDRVVSRQVAYWLYQLVDGRMAWYRAGHLGAHVLAAGALFLLVRRLIPAALDPSPAGAGRAAFGPALAIALLFALHPVQVYAVGDPGQLELVLATLLSLLLLLAYATAVLRGSRTALLASALLYPLAVLSKENVIAMPAVAAALTVLVRRPSRALVREVWPWYAVTALVAVLVFAGEVVQHGDAGTPRGARASVTEDVTPSGDARQTHLRSAVTQCSLFFRYLLLWLVPYPGWMSIDVHLPLARGLLAWPEIAGVAAFCAFPVAAGALLLRGGRAGLVGFGLLWPWLLFLPELATTRITELFVLYRSYPWIAGPLSVVVVLLAPRLGRLAMPLLCAACAALGVLAHERLLTFRSAYAVWDDAVRKNAAVERSVPSSHRPYLNRGRTLLSLGRLDAALRDFEIALELYPGLAYAHWNRALAYIAKNEPDLAFAAFDEGFAAASGVRAVARARAHSNRAGLHLRLGRAEDALADLRHAVALDPGREEYRRNAELLADEIRRAADSAPRRATSP